MILFLFKEHMCIYIYTYQIISYHIISDHIMYSLVNSYHPNCPNIAVFRKSLEVDDGRDKRAARSGTATPEPWVTRRLPLVNGPFMRGWRWFHGGLLELNGTNHDIVDLDGTI